MTTTDTHGDYALEWEVHFDYEESTTVRYESDSGRISIYYGTDDVWDLYPCEASSLVNALIEALKAAELGAANYRR